MRKVYISGSMSGVPERVWRQRFQLVAMKYKTLGYEVKNPGESVLARHGWLYRLVGYRWTLWYDLRMLRRCDYIAMVGSDWKQSRGARLERMKARKWCVREIE